MTTDAERLAALAEIQSLKARYWRCIDTKDWQDLVDHVFVADLAADFTGTGGGTYSSAADVAAMLERTLATAASAHLGGPPEIELLGADEARAIWPFHDHIERPGHTIDGAGHYHDTYRLTPDGWRIASTRITRLHLDVTRPGAEQAIQQLLYTYADRIDAGDFAGVAELFTHGRIAARAGAPDAEAVVGAEAVLARYESTTRRYDDDGTPHTQHLTTNVAIDVDHAAGTASATSRFTVLQRTETLALQPIITGRYEDTFHQIDGEWWFDTRVMHLGLIGDLSQHLLVDLG